MVDRQNNRIVSHSTIEMQIKSYCQKLLIRRQFKRLIGLTDMLLLRDLKRMYLNTVVIINYQWKCMLKI